MCRCRSLNAIWEDEYNQSKECEGCGLNYIVNRTYDRNAIEEIEYIIPKAIKTCDGCGHEFEYMIENLCTDCENKYSYGE